MAPKKVAPKDAKKPEKKRSNKGTS